MGIKNFISISAKNKKHLAIKEIADTACVALPNTTIVSYQNALLTPTNHLFVKRKYIPSGPITPNDNKQLSFFQKHYLYLKSRFVPSVRSYVGEYFWIHYGWSKNYYHWMCETLPRFYSLKIKYPKNKAILPKEYLNVPFINNTIRLLDIEYVLINTGLFNRFANLKTVLASPPVPEIDVEAQIMLREEILKRILKNEQNIRHEKIYISRQKAKRRKIINEEDVIAVLKKHNYKVIIAEELSFTEQVVLFSNAKAMIGLHGAGLTNIMFMPFDSKVMEIRNNDWSSQPLCFWKLANLFNIRWEYYQGKPTSLATNMNDLTVDIPSFEIDLEKFEKDSN